VIKISVPKNNKWWLTKDLYRFILLSAWIRKSYALINVVFKCIWITTRLTWQNVEWLWSFADNVEQLLKGIEKRSTMKVYAQEENSHVLNAHKNLIKMTINHINKYVNKRHFQILQRVQCQAKVAKVTWSLPAIINMKLTYCCQTRNCNQSSQRWQVLSRKPF